MIPELDVVSKNKFQEAWEVVKKNAPPCTRVRKIVSLPFKEFSQQVLAQESHFVEDMVKSLYQGDLYILRKVFSVDFINQLKQKLWAWGNSTPSEFHKMFDGVPDFHRHIVGELIQKYSFEASKHSYYFFPWNNDPFSVFQAVRPVWRVIKVLGGSAPDRCERHLPHDGVVERMQVAHLPPGTGFMEMHTDPIENNKIIIVGAMSKKGIDYLQGGVFFLDQNNQRVEIDNFLEMGDLYIGYPSLPHAVDTIEGDKNFTGLSLQGRWILLPFMVYSDYVETKDRSYPVKVRR